MLAFKSVELERLKKIIKVILPTNIKKCLLHDMYSSSYVISIMKSRRVRWTGHVAFRAEKVAAYGDLCENHKERVH
jgi:hypothetical protein